MINRSGQAEDSYPPLAFLRYCSKAVSCWCWEDGIKLASKPLGKSPPPDKKL